MKVTIRTNLKKISEYLIGTGAIVLSIAFIALSNENAKLKELYQDYILEECPLCQGEAELLPVNDSFYIECNDCELHTDYYDSKSKLVDYWNRR